MSGFAVFSTGSGTRPIRLARGHHRPCQVIEIDSTQLVLRTYPSAHEHIAADQRQEQQSGEIEVHSSASARARLLDGLNLLLS